MNFESQFEHEQESLDRQLEAGTITSARHRELVRDLWREYRDAAREAAQRAYDSEMERW
jgi:hypothetical protein